MHLGNPVGRAEVVQASATSLAHLPDGSVDYVFMDPPFGSNIFYADSSLLWDAWLGSLTDEREEIVVNKHRTTKEGGKSLGDYQQLMAAGLREVTRILKPDSYATVQFNNSSDEVWCAIQDAIHDAGLEIKHAVGLDKIHPSIKGVKGQQAKESVASLDSLLELRRRRSSKVVVSRPTSSETELKQALVAFAETRFAPFTTDQAFSSLVQSILRSGGSLAGVSSQTVKAMCAELFVRKGASWSVPNVDRVSEAEEQAFTPVDSPFGCIVETYLSSDDEISALLEPDRSARSVAGEAPRSVSGQRNTALYNAHSYHTKVPPEAITPFLKHYTRPGDVVLDPFCGTGMTGVAAMQLGRRAILNDLSVVAAHLSHNHTRSCSTALLETAFKEVESDLIEEFKELYACTDGKQRGYVYYTLWSRDASCPHCATHFSIWNSIDRDTGRMPAMVKCPKCRRSIAKQGLKYAGNRPVLISYKKANGERAERPLLKADLALLNRYTSNSPAAWYPRVKVEASREMYIRSALHLQGIKEVADFYTPRNLRALALLWARIQQVKDLRARSALSFAFTNTAWHGTRMRRFNARGGQRPLTGTLYIPQLSSEANVLEVMRNKIRQLRSYYEALGDPQSEPPAIRLGSATNLEGIADASIDYVFTDPPFGSNLFYADCNLIWESWLGGITKPQDEAIVNRSRKAEHGGKSVADYEALMSASMAEIFRVLKPGAWATLVFHNTDPSVWRAIQTAAESAGFQIDKAASLDRKQQSHKGYKGRAQTEKVAHFDVIMSMRKRKAGTHSSKLRQTVRTPQQLVLEAFDDLPLAKRTVQRVHSEVIQRLAREGLRLDFVSYDDVRAHMPDGPIAIERGLA
jgi:DNA modification methylase